MEAAAIDLIGLENLTNLQKGHHSSVYGRITVDEINLRYDKEILTLDDITDDVIMIRVNQNYRNGMSEFELYEITRSCWKVSKIQAEKVKYAFSVYDGMILEVYEITAWVPAFSTMHIIKQKEEIIEKDKGRFEFVGVIANDDIRAKYKGKMVSDLFSKGNQNPIKYIIHEKQ